MSKSSSLDQNTFKSLTKVYVIALCIIALLVFITQIFIQRALSSNNYDANIINIAGRQRMLSQKISKGILLSKTINIDSKRNIKMELDNAVQEWRSSHTLLKNNLANIPDNVNTKKLENQFSKVTIEINELLNIYDHLSEQINFNKEYENQWVTTFIQKEPDFLKEMNLYVDNYEEYASNKITVIKYVEYAAFGFLIFLLLLEFFLLFLPTAKKIKATISELLNAKDNALEMAERANNAVDQKNETLIELQLLQKAIDQNLFFARFDKNGHIIEAGRKIKELIAKQTNVDRRIIYDSIGLSENDSMNLRDLVNAGKGAILNHEFKVALEKSKMQWLDISIFPVVKLQGITEYILVCLDISSRKKAQAEIDALNIEQAEAERASQKAKASMIVEAQEEERKRIAKDIHDSIGQMLTALKFNLESLNPEQTEKLPDKIENLKVQTKDIILGVRMATFNLTPPELLDYGVVTAIQKMVTQLNKYTNTQILFENSTPVDMRFETLVETNLYRVTQECINNAIKYAEAKFIYVNVKKTDQLLSISITDNGKGFDKSTIPKSPKGGTEGGMGMFFMKERMEYINGRIFLNSQPGNGTRAVLNYPIK